jgi:hypothetical protein
LPLLQSKEENLVAETTLKDGAGMREIDGVL